MGNQLRQLPMIAKFDTTIHNIVVAPLERSLMWLQDPYRQTSMKLVVWNEEGRGGATVSCPWTQKDVIFNWRYL